ncbi:MAG: ABC transporter permease [Caldilineaceae bacterium]|nr:ABC transporter permease [Caldilineaceae bacterium]
MRRTYWTPRLLEILLPVAAVLLAFALGGILLLALGANPFQSFWTLLSGAFGSVSGLTSTLAKATPLLLVGLGICISFRGGVINIGGEGQIIVGALASTALALALRDWPGWLLLPLTLLAGALAGALWGGIAGLLKARLNVNEILSTVMLNAIALQIMNSLLRGLMLDPAQIAAGTNIPQSETLPQQVWLLKLVPRTLLHSGAILALVLAILVYFLLWRTTIGYRIRTVGLNPSAARYAGIPVPFYVALSLTLAGAFAGLAGAVEVVGVQHRMLEGLSGGYGFSGIVAALFGKLHPLGAVPASFLFGGLLVGADKMQRAIQVPSALIVAINGLVVMFVVASDVYVRRVRRRAGKEAAAASLAESVARSPGGTAVERRAESGVTPP